MATKLDTKKWEEGLNGLKRPELAEVDEAGLSKMRDAIANRKPFSYDVNNDPMYQNYKDQYVRGGKMAMQDTMGNAAALSGGYGNSYAATAGNQAYQQHLSGLNSMIPELMNAAYNRYQTELANQRADYEMEANAQQGRYNRSMDAYNVFNNERNFLYGGLMDATQFNYNADIDERNYNRGVYESDRTFKYTKEQDEKDNALKWANYNASQENAKLSLLAEQNTAYQKQIANVQAQLDKMEENGANSEKLAGVIAASGLDYEDQLKLLDMYPAAAAFVDGQTIATKGLSALQALMGKK